MLVDPEDRHWLDDHAWTITKSSNAPYYVQLRVNGRYVQLHRLILEAPAGVIDHRNGNGLDNRRSNLRPATHQQNAFNSAPQRGRRSPFKGVDWHQGRQKWRARIKFNRREVTLGYFGDELDAARAYDEAAGDLFGEFARLNELPGPR